MLPSLRLPTPPAIYAPWGRQPAQVMPRQRLPPIESPPKILPLANVRLGEDVGGGVWAAVRETPRGSPRGSNPSGSPRDGPIRSPPNVAYPPDGDGDENLTYDGNAAMSSTLGSSNPREEEMDEEERAAAVENDLVLEAMNLEPAID